MEFWGAEIKPGQTVKVEPGEGFVLHLSQATLGESKKGNVPVLLNLKVGEQKFVLGSLSHEKFPQLSFDLIFDDEFELSHNWKNGSVYFVGYKSMLPDEEEDVFSDEFDSDEEAPELIPAGKPEKTDDADAKAKAAKNASFDVPKVGDDDSDEDDDDDSDDDDSEDDESDEDAENGLGSDEVMLDGESDDESESEDDDDDSSEDDEEDEEETPKKVESGKKRPAEPSTQTPASKKGKATPEKKDGKKAGQTATPHPAKQAKKTPGNKAQPQSPLSNGKKSNKKAKHMGK